MKKIAISIPVHLEPSVVENHLYNIMRFVPNSMVVLHVSADGPPGLFEQLAVLEGRMNGFLYLNNRRYPTYSPHDAGNVTGLSTVHSSNFRFLSERVGFDVFALETSNDMFVRKGIEAVFEAYKCGFCTRRDFVENNSSQDAWLDIIRKHLPLKAYEKGPQEGSFYPSAVFKDVAEVVLDKIGGFVAGEEGVLPVIAFNLYPELYDSNSSHYVFHNPHHAEVTQEDIEKTRRGEYVGRYAVKRVPRSMSSPCRAFVNKLTEND